MMLKAWEKLPEPFRGCIEAGRIVFPVHRTQRSVTSRLQREMKMRADFSCHGKLFAEIIGDHGRFKRPQAYAHPSGNRGNR